MSKVLIIEPDHLLAKTFCQALESAGVAAMSVSNAQQAITSIDTLRPDLIVLEIQLAGHNGVEFLYELRSQQDWQDIPALIVSVVPEADLGLSNELRQRLGIVGYAYKPQLRLQDLIERVQENLFAKKS